MATVSYSESLCKVFNQPLTEVREEAQFQKILSRLPENRPLRTTRFCFLRHGTSEGKTKNLAGGGLDTDRLTSKGVEEIQALGEKFLQNSASFNAIFTSPAASAIQTAEILAKTLYLPVTEDLRLRQKHWGSYHGLPIDAAYKQTRVEGEKATDGLSTYWEKWNFKFDKGETDEESLREVFDRTIQFLLETAQNPELKGKNICLSTHTPLLKALFASLVALNFGQDLAYHRHDFINGGMLGIDISEEGVPSLGVIEGVCFRSGVKYS